MPFFASIPDIDSHPALLLLRGKIREQAGAPEGAVADFSSAYYRYPVSAEAPEAGSHLDSLAALLGPGFPQPSLELRMGRANALYGAQDWRLARDAYQDLLPLLSGEESERAAMRLARCRVALGEPLDVLTDLRLPAPQVDAERDLELAEIYRTRKQEPELDAAVEAAATRAPDSVPAQQALFLAGNYYWAQLQRDTAVKYYARLTAPLPATRDAVVIASWRVVWTAYLNGSTGAADQIAQYIRKFPDSPFIPDAVYFLGRSAELLNQAPRARYCYARLSSRFPETYFGMLASRRLDAIGAAPLQTVAALAAIPSPLPALPLAQADPPDSAGRRARSRALSEIAFDASAELELRAAYAATHDPQLLLDAAQAANAAGHYPIAIVLTRQIYPRIEARSFADVPAEVWRTIYPFPYESEIRSAAACEGVNPFLLAGLTRQESAFQRDARSSSDAWGLTQLLPRTARRISRRIHLRYSHSRLTDPRYNLRVGAAYLSQLISMFGSREAAVAAYNAGEDRVSAWVAERNYSEPAEFVESIPFTQTREYVQIVLRNAALYSRLYGSGHSTAAGGR
jgi:peptidoglycan lytic transglycosylase